ncbi:MAG TPA: hypothetical protein VFW09_16915 [Solirubrobacteraceae bacterium]|nr:hypothetical protein [Solirubrobacteraceae bacterium]
MTAADGGLPLTGALPELADVPWRPLADEPALRRTDRRWTLWLVAQELPLVAIAVGLPLLSPLLVPMSLIALAFAWFIPDLWAAKGAEVLRPPRLPGGVAPSAETRAIGLLGDLIDHRARELLTRTGLVVERGRLGVWVIAGKGAVLVRGRGRRVECYCVRATGDDLPLADRIAHLLLALRADEPGFATVSNLSFSGARWRLSRRLPAPAKDGLAAAAMASGNRDREVSSSP